jgi:hypothetical protein
MAAALCDTTMPRDAVADALLAVTVADPFATATSVTVAPVDGATLATAGVLDVLVIVAPERPAPDASRATAVIWASSPSENSVSAVRLVIATLPTTAPLPPGGEVDPGDPEAPPPHPTAAPTTTAIKPAGKRI